MTDPATALTVGVIAELAFKTFLETAAGAAATKFTEAALSKMNELRKKIVGRLSGVAGAKTAIDKLEGQAGTSADVETVADYLKIVMREDPQFADELRLLAKEINAGKIQDESQMTQNIYDNATGYQGKAENNSTLNQAQTININYGVKPPTD
ncbi:MAG: hypothetical protein AAF703_10160 [Cyanobacteria bacterium P01_D01_bin.105]